MTPAAAQDEESKARRQEELSKAMGALFLQHKVEALEHDVESLEYRRGRHKPSMDRASKPTRAAAGSATSSLGPIAARDKWGGPSRPHRESRSPQAARRVCVVDASALIYSLRTVHGLLKEKDVRTVVPMEALTTLDILKKGDHPISQGARKAIRLIEEKLSSPSRNGADAQQPGRLAPGLFVQREEESADWDDNRVEAAASTRSGAYMGTTPSVDQQDSRRTSLKSTFKDPLPPSMSGHSSDKPFSATPVHVRETLKCVKWIAKRTSQASAEVGEGTGAQKATWSLMVARPPTWMQGINAASSCGTSQRPKYASRADGGTIEAFALSLGLVRFELVAGSTWDASNTGRGEDGILLVAPTSQSWIDLGPDPQVDSTATATAKPPKPQPHQEDSQVDSTGEGGEGVVGAQAWSGRGSESSTGRRQIIFATT